MFLGKGGKRFVEPPEDVGRNAALQLSFQPVNGVETYCRSHGRPLVSSGVTSGLRTQVEVRINMWFIGSDILHSLLSF